MACCEFVSISTQYSINDVPNVLSFPESILNEIANIAIRQGRLQKYVVSKVKEEWKEEYFWLDVDRLWYLSLKGWETEKQLSYVDLNETTEAKMTNLLTCTFTNNYNSTGRGAMLLKARSKDEADHWIADINNRKKLKSDNLIVTAIENITGETESKCSHRDMDKINQISTFEGMICNSTFRRNFRRYLQQIMLVDAFRFWEQAEDYRRSHPYSSQPFQIGINVDKKTVASKGVTPAQVMKAWAKRLYVDFLAPDARFRIPYIYENIDSIREVIETTAGCPPATVFESLQKTCFQKMKSELYPEFIKQDQYRKAFQSAIRPNPQQDIEKMSNLKVEDQTGTAWRFQALPEDSYWLPDYWWLWTKDYLTQPSTSDKGSSTNSNNNDARPVLTKYLKLSETLLLKQDIEMLKAMDSQFKVSKIQENAEPILDELFSPNAAVRPSFIPKLMPLLRPGNVNIAGGCIGNVAMFSLMKCKYHRRAFANAKVGLGRIDSTPISPNKTDPRIEKINKGKVPDLNQTQLTVTEDVGRKRSLSEDYVGVSSGIEWKQHLLVLIESLSGSGRLLILDSVTHVVNAILHVGLISEVRFHSLFTFRHYEKVKSFLISSHKLFS